MKLYDDVNVIILQLNSLFHMFFQISLPNLPSLTFPLCYLSPWNNISKQLKQQILKQKQQYISTTLLLKPCQRPKPTMSKVMTMSQIQRLRYKGGGVVRVVTMWERSPPLWAICGLVHWQSHVSATSHVMNFARGFLKFSFTGNWSACLFFICMTGM